MTDDMSKEKMNAEKVVEMLEKVLKPGALVCPYCETIQFHGDKDVHAPGCEITQAIEWVRGFQILDTILEDTNKPEGAAVFKPTGQSIQEDVSDTLGEVSGQQQKGE